ncbi:MAG: haloacid dehalogenase-like hydrolase [Solirubrobacteraceae bacterium]|nr:haloacid dehalogenase-like hydrolase [Solirubrobacteraceae bacterium]
MLLLFDIDGTLLLNGADAHAAAVVAALCEVWEVEPPPRAHGVEAAGRTDQAIARDILELAGVPAEEFDRRRDDFVLATGSHYERLVPDDLSDRLAPHATDVLSKLAVDQRYRCSLVTGNIQPVARLKLGAAGILYPFAEGQGGFGSDSADRNDLPPIARMRAGQLWNGGDAWPAERTVVIGDTPRDIACARADGALVVAVATGPFGADQLSEADVVLEDLRELDAALQSL